MGFDDHGLLEGGVPVAGAPKATDSEAVAVYIADLSGLLAALSRRHGLSALAYILDMAREEAMSNAPLRQFARRD